MILSMYVFMCLECAHGCLGAWEGGPLVLGRLPLALGALPGGPLRGLPGPMSAGQNRLSPFGFSTKTYVLLDDDFWSFWARSWVLLGSCSFLLATWPA